MDHNIQKLTTFVRSLIVPDLSIPSIILARDEMKFSIVPKFGSAVKVSRIKVRECRPNYRAYKTINPDVPDNLRGGGGLKETSCIGGASLGECSFNVNNSAAAHQYRVQPSTRGPLRPRLSWRNHDTLSLLCRQAGRMLCPRMRVNSTTVN
ncbi:uncharacterized protein [Anoplolepis gracilipes]|uniref:uncharacterized protein n=1 Tax=Anoplolepis gracilipes TaxID=354296 RepID=UPI003B9FA7FB